MNGRAPHSVLLYPPINVVPEALQIWTTSYAANFPLGLLRLARYLREQEGHRVTLLDAFLTEGPSEVKDAANLAQLLRPERRVREAPMGNLAAEGRRKPIYRVGLSRSELTRRLEALGRVDHFHISSIFTWSWATTHECVELCRATHPEAVIHLGGVYPTLCPEKAAETGADEVHVGDLPQLDAVWPDLALTGRSDLEVSILKTSVGCPNACTYCAVTLLEGRKMRFRDPEDVAREVSDVHRRHGLRQFHFWESNLLLKADVHFHPLMDALIETGLPLQFRAPEGVQTDLIDAAIAEKMHRGGFIEVFLALETTDEEWAKRTGRPTGFAQLKNAAEALLAAGFSRRQVVCVLLIGQPGQTLDSILRDILSIYTLGLVTVLLTYTLIPGTVEFARRPDLVAERPLEDLDPLLFPFASPELMVADMERLLRYFNFQSFPIARIRGSQTSDPLIRRMQALLAAGDFAH